MSTSQDIYRQISEVENLINSYLNNQESIYTVDDAVLKLFYVNEKIHTGRSRKTWLNTHKVIYDYLNNRFSDADSVSEVLYRLKYKLYERPHCELEGCEGHVIFDGVHGFKHHCCMKHAQLDKKVREKIEDACIRKYGVRISSQAEEVKRTAAKNNLEKYGVEWSMQRPEVKQKSKETCLEKYGVDSVCKVPEVREKQRQTLYSNYGVYCPGQSEEIKKKQIESLQKHYGVINYSQTQEWKNRIKEHKEDILNKIYNTKKKNKSFNYSRPEDKCYELLLSKYNVIRQYKSDLYPFQADFYIPELDLYIEYQGTWCHGGHPYDPNSEEDLKRLNYLQNKLNEGHPYYENAIIVWTQKDPLKRETAKDNNINLIEFWNLQEVEDWLNTLK